MDRGTQNGHALPFGYIVAGYSRVPLEQTNMYEASTLQGQPLPISLAGLSKSNGLPLVPRNYAQGEHVASYTNQSSTTSPTLTSGVSRFTPQGSRVSVPSGNVSSWNNSNGTSVHGNYQQKFSPSAFVSDGSLHQDDFTSVRGNIAVEATTEDHYDDESYQRDVRSTDELTGFSSQMPFGNGHSVLPAMNAPSGEEATQFTNQYAAMLMPTANEGSAACSSDVNGPLAAAVGRPPKRIRTRFYDHYHRKSLGHGTPAYIRQATCSPEIDPTASPWNHMTAVRGPCTVDKAHFFSGDMSAANLYSNTFIAHDAIPQPLVSEHDTLDNPPGDNPLGLPPQYNGSV